jgi:hypothetical protein
MENGNSINLYAKLFYISFYKFMIQIVYIPNTKVIREFPVWIILLLNVLKKTKKYSSQYK